MSPEMTLNSVVFPAPLGPRIARRSPGATSSSTSRTAWSPPKRRPTPRKRRVGSAFFPSGRASGTRLLHVLLGDHAVLDDLDLPLPRKMLLHAGREAATRCGLVRPERAAERLVDARHVTGDRDAGALRDLHLVLVLDRVPAAVELHDAVVRDLVRVVDLPRQRGLERSANCAVRLVQPKEEGMSTP